jgi:hypothetical protein
MKNTKNILIAILTGLVALSVSMQSSDGASVKTYDSLKLAQYTACINAQLNWDIALMQANNGNGTLYMSDAINKKCNSYRP